MGFLRMATGINNHCPTLTKGGNYSLQVGKIVSRLSYLESLSTQVSEAMPMQHREADRRQLRETESKIFQTGFSHSRKDWSKGNLDHLAVPVKRFPKHLLHKFQRDPRTRTAFNNTAQKSPNVLYVTCTRTRGAAVD